jgi:hypothetical protein
MRVTHHSWTFSDAKKWKTVYKIGQETKIFILM